ncbi:MAG: ATP-binding protein [Bacteroidales bacterium]|nr:ATP-binding protein [Bacteroidales bacterium]
MKPHRIHQLIAEGENEHLDFKFEIADSRKIAKTFVAFANSGGGKLLIGVKDNGVIAGIRTEEEKYMAEAAAAMYCSPNVLFETREWNIKGKVVLEVTIPEGNEKPYFMQNEHNSWLAYIRVGDENILANKIIVNAWKRKSRPEGTYINYSHKEKLLLEYLESNDTISLSKFRNLAGISQHSAENILINFLALDILDFQVIDKQFFYSLSNTFGSE